MTTVTLSHAVLLEACAEVGLGADKAEPLRIGENALWRLPHQVVVRVARPGQWAAAVRELAVARWLHDCEVPAVRPLDTLTEPIEVYGHPVTFWHELPPHRAGTAADIAPLLKRLHQLPVPAFQLGRLDPFVRLSARINEATTLDEEQRRWLWDRLVILQAAWADLPAGRPESVIHGDAWGGNVAVTATTSYLLDFERSSLGPPEWDLVSTAVGHGTFGTVPNHQYEAFCDAYGTDVTAWAGYPVLRDIRELRVTLFALQAAARDPERFRDQAHYRLACLQGEYGLRPWGWTAVG